MCRTILFSLEREKGGKGEENERAGRALSSLISLNVNRCRIKLKIYMYTDRLSLSREREREREIERGKDKENLFRHLMP